MADNKVRKEKESSTIDKTSNSFPGVTFHSKFSNYRIIWMESSWRGRYSDRLTSTCGFKLDYVDASFEALAPFK